MVVRTLLISLLCAAGIACLLRYEKPAASGGGLQGKAAPEISLSTLDGKQVKLSDMKGKVVLVDFWATWCPPCRKSLPHLQALSTDSERARSGLVVWAVNAGEQSAEVQTFVSENKFTFTVPLDPGETQSKYQVEGIPTTVIVGRDGIVKDLLVGFGPGSEKLIDDAVNAALAEK